MKENPSRENAMKVCKGYNIKDAIVVIEREVKAVKPKTINSCWRKLYPDVVHYFTGLVTEPIKKIMKEICGYGNKDEGQKVSRYGPWRNSKANRQHTRESNRR